MTLGRRTSEFAEENKDGLPESRDSNVRTRKRPVLSEGPINLDLVEAKRGEVLWTRLVGFDPDDPIVKAAPGENRTRETAAAASGWKERAGGSGAQATRGRAR